MLPPQFAIVAEGRQDALSALHEYIASLAINRCTGSSVALINCVTNKIIVEPLPNFFASLRVETGDTFLQIRAIAEIAHNIQLPIGDDWRGLAGKVGDPKG